MNILEFTSTRKRMSVIVQDSQNRYILLTKGADYRQAETQGRVERVPGRDLETRGQLRRGGSEDFVPRIEGVDQN